jgi:ribonuclease HI
VVAQANGAVPARGEAVRIISRTFHALVGDGPMPRVRHIKRTQNLAGIALARGDRMIAEVVEGAVIRGH